ncbi:hypothetical protein CRG98_008972 [Punica granatum]|uniref:Uncharacterized protein n=1 Tax=Punica granatum TaxID=22663 RepID=A0A2I0KQL9_PUNGR|nr:hypothetical protein CRG98_008972 [Punica granatum]
MRRKIEKEKGEQRCCRRPGYHHQTGSGGLLASTSNSSLPHHRTGTSSFLSLILAAHCTRSNPRPLLYLGSLHLQPELKTMAPPRVFYPPPLQVLRLPYGLTPAPAQTCTSSPPRSPSGSLLLRWHQWLQEPASSTSISSPQLRFLEVHHSSLPHLLYLPSPRAQVRSSISSLSLSHTLLSPFSSSCRSRVLPSRHRELPLFCYLGLEFGSTSVVFNPPQTRPPRQS